jgi:multidrug transporter EmrE-like cation transporter
VAGGRQGRGGALLALHVLLGIYSLSDVASKKASQTEFLSPGFIGFYLVVLALLAVYAIGWQQVIKRMPLSSAYANRAVTVVWGIFWGCAIFGEQMSAGKLVGAALIICGVVLFARVDRRDAESARGDEGASS